MTQDQIREHLMTVMEMPALTFNQRVAIAEAFANTFLLMKMREAP